MEVITIAVFILLYFIFIYCQTFQDNLFEWHFTVRGPPDSPYSDGVYHGRILLPAEYPMKPPNLILLTPNGRFETNKKICLRFTFSTKSTNLVEFQHQRPSPRNVASILVNPNSIARVDRLYAHTLCGSVRRFRVFMVFGRNEFFNFEFFQGGTPTISHQVRSLSLGIYFR